MSNPAASTHITHLGTIFVPVNDQDRALDFYMGRLGFEKRTDTPFGNGDRWVEVSPAGGQTTIALVRPREGESAGIDTRIAFTSEDIDADHAALRNAGVDVDEEIMRFGPPVPPMFFLRDQDGNRLVAVQREPTS